MSTRDEPKSRCPKCKKAWEPIAPHGEVSDMSEVAPTYKIKCPKCKIQWSSVQLPAEEWFVAPTCPFCKVSMLLHLEQLTPPLPSAQILRLEPGDVIVLKSPTTLPSKEKITEALGPAFPGYRVVTLDGGVDLQVVRPSKAKEVGE